MRTHNLKSVIGGGPDCTCCFFKGFPSVRAMTPAEIDKDVQEALAHLYEKSPTAKEFGEIAQGILVFPDVCKAGFMVGGQLGEGALLKNGKTAGYDNSIEASCGP